MRTFSSVKLCEHFLADFSCGFFLRIFSCGLFIWGLFLLQTTDYFYYRVAKMSAKNLRTFFADIFCWLFLGFLLNFQAIFADLTCGYILRIFKDFLLLRIFSCGLFIRRVFLRTFLQNFLCTFLADFFFRKILRIFWRHFLGFLWATDFLRIFFYCIFSCEFYFLRTFWFYNYFCGLFFLNCGLHLQEKNIFWRQTLPLWIPQKIQSLLVQI